MKNLTLVIALFLSAQLLNAQTLSWKNTEQHPSVGQPNDCFGVAIDSHGNTIMAYTLSLSSFLTYIAINKYNPQGVLITSAYLPRIETSYLDFGKKLFLDSADNIYIQAQLNTFSGIIWVAAVAKFNNNLIFQWQHEVADYGILNYFSKPIDMETDAQFNLYSLCKVVDTIPNQGAHYKIVKYSASGSELFNIDIANLTCNIHIRLILDMAVDAQGNIFLHGSAYDLANNDCAFTAKYSPTGVKLWYRKFVVPHSGYVNGGGYANHCVADAQGNVIVAGYYGFSSTSQIIVPYLIKYSPLGTRLFKRDAVQYAKQSYTSALQTDSASNLYHVILMSYDEGNHSTFSIQKYNSAGKLLATCPIVFGKLIDFKVSKGGSVFALGGFLNTYTNLGVDPPTLLKINTQLKYEWDYNYNTFVNNQNQLSDLPTHLAISRDNAEVAVAGTYSAALSGGAFENGFTIVNLNNESIARVAYNGSDEFCNDNLPNEKMLSNELVITPNPTSDFISINKNDISLIEILNMSGQIIKSFQPKNETDSKQYDVSKLPAGVYMIQATSADGVSSCKFVKQ